MAIAIVKVGGEPKDDSQTGEDHGPDCRTRYCPSPAAPIGKRDKKHCQDEEHAGFPVESGQSHEERKLAPPVPSCQQEPHREEAELRLRPRVEKRVMKGQGHYGAFQQGRQ
ncbi:MAG: hypothetical protein ACLQGV_00515 [Bryobacteraceae bacterium]